MRNPTGTGNPPGSNYEGSLSGAKESSYCFVEEKSYQGSMNVGRNQSTVEMGNQPKSISNESLESRSNHTKPF